MLKVEFMRNEKKNPKTKNQFLEGARDSHEEHRTSDFSYSFKFTSLVFLLLLFVWGFFFVYLFFVTENTVILGNNKNLNKPLFFECLLCFKH